MKTNPEDLSVVLGEDMHLNETMDMGKKMVRIINDKIIWIKA